jgi:hypothetical protein
MAGSEAKAPPMPVLVTGMVDLERRQVRGFGLTIEPIRVLNPARIEFGSGDRGAGSIVEGTIDRATLRTEIAIRSRNDAKSAPTVMRLECDAKPSLY